MKYSDLVSVYSNLEKTSKRLEKTYIISQFLKKAPATDLDNIILLLQGIVFKRTEENNLGVASKLVIKALKNASGYDEDYVLNLFKKTGDLGEVASELIKKKKQFTLSKEELSVKKVFESIKKLAIFEGEKSQERKIKSIESLLTSAEPEEAKYIIRTILEDLRVGAGEGTLRDAIVWAFFSKETELKYDDKNKSVSYNDEIKKYTLLVQEAYDLTHDFALVVASAKLGEDKLSKIEMIIGNPFKVMLAIKEPTIETAMDCVGSPSVIEYKYDGFRLIVHKRGKIVKLFTRRLENVTKQFPDIVEAIIENVKAKNCILDSEAVGYNKKTKKYIAFQKISQRIRRKYDIDKIAKEFPIELNVFDLLNLEEKSTINLALKERFSMLKKIIKEESQKIVIAKHIITDNEKTARDFFKEAISLGHEGVMFKNNDAPYKPGSRVGYMVKYKEAMESLDLAIVAAEWGEGKRSGWLSSYLVACQDEDGNLLEIGRVSTGLKEKAEEGLSFEEMTKKLKPLIKKESGKEVRVKPVLVIEVEFEEIQKSPSYSSGYALRFPRVIRLREDKGLEDLSYIKDIDEQYKHQRSRS